MAGESFFLPQSDIDRRRAEKARVEVERRIPGIQIEEWVWRPELFISGHLDGYFFEVSALMGRTQLTLAAETFQYGRLIQLDVLYQSEVQQVPTADTVAQVMVDLLGTIERTEHYFIFGGQWKVSQQEDGTFTPLGYGMMPVPGKTAEQAWEYLHSEDCRAEMFSEMTSEDFTAMRAAQAIERTPKNRDERTFPQTDPVFTTID